MPEMELPREEVMALHTSGLERLAATLSGLSESDLDASIAPGEWTIWQIVHHLADAEGTFSMALKMAFGAPGSVFTYDWYPGNEEWGAELGHADRAIGPAPGILRAHREEKGRDSHSIAGRSVPDPRSSSAADQQILQC